MCSSCLVFSLFRFSLHISSSSSLSFSRRFFLLPPCLRLKRCAHKESKTVVAAAVIRFLSIMSSISFNALFALFFFRHVLFELCSNDIVNCQKKARRTAVKQKTNGIPNYYLCVRYLTMESASGRGNMRACVFELLGKTVFSMVSSVVCNELRWNMPQDSVASHVNRNIRNASKALQPTLKQRPNDNEGVKRGGAKGEQKIEIRCHCDCLTHSVTLKIPIHNCVRIKLELHKWEHLPCLYFDFHLNEIIRYRFHSRIVLSIAKHHSTYFPCCSKYWQNHHSFMAWRFVFDTVPCIPSIKC